MVVLKVFHHEIGCPTGLLDFCTAGRQLADGKVVAPWAIVILFQTLKLPQAFALFYGVPKSFFGSSWLFSRSFVFYLLFSASVFSSLAGPLSLVSFLRLLTKSLSLSSA